MQQGLILGLTAMIVTASVIIEIEKDPPTMDWVRQCLWGKENSYKGESEEIETSIRRLTDETMASLATSEKQRLCYVRALSARTGMDS